MYAVDENGNKRSNVVMTFNEGDQRSEVALPSAKAMPEYLLTPHAPLSAKLNHFQQIKRITTPAVASVSKAHYNCPSLAGELP